MDQQDKNVLLDNLQPLPTEHARPQTNPLLEKVQLPGKIYSLPSGCLMYKSGEVAAANNEIEVRPLSALAEIKMKNADLLLTGQAFEEVIRECVPSITKPMELYGKDVDALMCFIRYVTYGPLFEIEAAHTCDNKNHEYVVNLDEIMANMSELTEEDIAKNYVLTLENGQEVRLHPYKLKDIIEILTTTENDMPTAEDVQKNVIKQVLNMIQSVDGISDPKLIEEWVRQIPAPYVNDIVTKMEHAENWGPIFNQTLQCKNCGETFKVDLPINPVTFFSA